MNTSPHHQAEFQAFAATAAPELARTARLLCDDERLAEDLVQQALAHMYEAWDVARERDQLAYARRTLAYLRVDLWRRRRRERLVTPAPAPEHDAGHERDTLGRAIATIPPRRRARLLHHLPPLGEQERQSAPQETASRGPHLR